MIKKHVFERLMNLGLLAVIRGPSEELALKTVDVLVNAGILGIEITFSVPNAFSIVNKLNQKYGHEILLGMGTLTDSNQVQKAAENGAKFVVSPMYDEELCTSMVNSGLLSMMGSFTPTEVLQSYKKGIDVVKVFPASLGGPNYIRNLRVLFPNIPFMPTGGVDIDNVADWFSAGIIAVGAGSSLCPKDLILREDFDEISRIAGQFVRIINPEFNKQVQLRKVKRGKPV